MEYLQTCPACGAKLADDSDGDNKWPKWWQHIDDCCGMPNARGDTFSCLCGWMACDQQCRQATKNLPGIVVVEGLPTHVSAHLALIEHDWPTLQTTRILKEM